MSDEIARPAPARPVAWRQDARRERREGSGHPPASDHARAAGAYGRLGADGLDVHDSVSVQGIPPDELTPAVRRAVAALMAEVDRLRQALAGGGVVLPPHSLDPAATPPADDAGAAPALPGPRALAPMLDARLTALSLGGPAPAVVFFYPGTYEDIRARHGLAAAEAAARAVAAALAAARDDTEIMGRPAGAAVVAVLDFDGQVDRLWARARALAKAAGAPVPWRGETLRQALLVGVHVCRRGERAADALWQAERAARRIV